MSETVYSPAEASFLGLAVLGLGLFVVLVILAILALPFLVITSGCILFIWALLPAGWLRRKIGKNWKEASVRSLIASCAVTGVILLLHVPYLWLLGGDFDHTVLGVYYRREVPVYEKGWDIAWEGALKFFTWAGRGVSWTCESLYKAVEKVPSGQEPRADASIRTALSRATRISAPALPAKAFANDAIAHRKSESEAQSLLPEHHRGQECAAEFERQDDGGGLKSDQVTDIDSLPGTNVDFFPPSLICRVEPEYTDAARGAKLQGTVDIVLVVDENGLPRNVQAIQGVGLGLDEKAVEAVQKWKFQPGRKAGRTVPVQANVEVVFSMAPAGRH